MKKSLPVHAKRVPPIGFDALEELPGSDESLQLWKYERRWLERVEMYSAVPQRDRSGIPRCTYTAEQMQRLMECNVVRRISPEEIRGHVSMFLVLELAKERCRAIKNTVDINAFCGSDTLRKLAFPTKKEMVESVHLGSAFLAVDFAAYYDQFQLTKEVGALMCFEFNHNYYALNTLPMGQRQAVEIADAATQRLLDFPHLTQKAMSVIDNVCFIGHQPNDIGADGWTFVQRCAAAGATLNEIDVNEATREKVDALIKTAGPWCGIDFDFTNKTVRIMQKAVDKTRTSWEARASWDWRAFARHMGLLFWPWRIIDLPMPDFFDVFRFIAEFGKKMTDSQPPPRPDGSFPSNPEWNRPAAIPERVWQLLERWTTLVCDNKPRRVLPAMTKDNIDILVECDASNEYGFCYVALHIPTNQIVTYARAWSETDRKNLRDRLRHSVVAEPLGLVYSAQHLARRFPNARRFFFGQDNTPTVATFKRGFNTASYHLNLMTSWLQRSFPASEGYQFDFVHVPGKVILADRGSRGFRLVDVKDQGIAAMLRRHLGLEEGG